jgi:tetratricopeptide (TPR) repeat protein
MSPEISNKLISIGNQVLDENLQFRDAVEIVKSDRELNDLPDERLQALIQEANHYWFYDGDLARSRPENLLIYPLLTEVCAETRVKAIGQFRKGVQGEAKQSLDIRMATWIGILAECLLNKGMVLLLPDDPRSPQGSYEAFLRANLGARALPDFGQLRLREVLWSAHGMWLAAVMWKQSQLAQNALQERNALSKMPGRQVEAQAYILEIEAAFHKLLEAKQRRTKQIGINMETSRKSKDANKTFDYNALLTSIGNRVTAGELSIEQGKHDLLTTSRINLGVAIGNLGNVLEQMGDAVKAFANHYRAFQIFVREKDLHLVQDSLSQLTRLAVQSGRIDDAISAIERTATLAQDLANLQVAIESYLDLTFLNWRIGRFKQSVDAGLKAEQLITPQISGENRNQKYLTQYYDLLLLRGIVYTLLDKEPHTPEAKNIAYDHFEKARQIAVEIQDETRVSSALIQLAKLFEYTGNFFAAECYVESLNLMKTSSSIQFERDMILSNIKLQQRQYQDAIFYLKKAIDNNDNNNENFKLYTVWYTLGRAYKESGDFSSAVESLEKSLAIFEQSKVTLYESSRIDMMTYGAEIYDYLIALYADPTTPVYNPQQALFWLEKSKARTFIETIGLSVLPLHDPPAAIQSELLQESQLLDRINQIRGHLFFHREERIDNFEIQQELNHCLEQLDTVLDRIAEYCPEYVDLRRGDVVNWNEIKLMLYA